MCRTTLQCTHRYLLLTVTMCFFSPRRESSSSCMHTDVCCTHSSSGLWEELQRAEVSSQIWHIVSFLSLSPSRVLSFSLSAPHLSFLLLAIFPSLHLPCHLLSIYYIISFSLSLSLSLYYIIYFSLSLSLSIPPSQRVSIGHLVVSCAGMVDSFAWCVSSAH